MKRIAIFCDGTWNTPDKADNGKPCPTNVVKMALALSETSADGTKQLLYYDTGIGSQGDKIQQVFDGATGTGITEKILQAYRYIIANYEPGDELFLFGFSRGAFTVRSLSGLIRNSGILKKENVSQIPKAFRYYRSRKDELHPKAVETTLFRKTYAVENVTGIKFIGVWDTVGALGNPLILKGIASKQNQFHDTDLSSYIEFAYHALSVDEKRRNFQPAIWKQQSGAGHQVLEQVWFPGVHSVVGGGYPAAGLSDIALDWMLEKAENCHLKFEKIDRTPDPMGTIHETYEGFYRLIPKYFRGIDLPDAGDGKKTCETLHPAVKKRHTGNNAYAPKNLMEYLERKAALKNKV